MVVRRGVAVGAQLLDLALEVPDLAIDQVYEVLRVHAPLVEARVVLRHHLRHPGLHHLERLGAVLAERVRVGAELGDRLGEGVGGVGGDGVQLVVVLQGLVLQFVQLLAVTVHQAAALDPPLLVVDVRLLKLQDALRQLLQSGGLRCRASRRVGRRVRHDRVDAAEALASRLA